MCTPEYLLHLTNEKYMYVFVSTTPMSVLIETLSHVIFGAYVCC